MAGSQESNLIFDGSRHPDQIFRISNFGFRISDLPNTHPVIRPKNRARVNSEFRFPNSEFLLNVAQALQLLERVLVELFLGAEVGIERGDRDHLFPSLEVTDHYCELVGFGL